MFPALSSHASSRHRNHHAPSSSSTCFVTFYYQLLGSLIVCVDIDQGTGGRRQKASKTRRRRQRMKRLRERERTDKTICVATAHIHPYKHTHNRARRHAYVLKEIRAHAPVHREALTHRDRHTHIEVHTQWLLYGTWHCRQHAALPDKYWGISLPAVGLQHLHHSSFNYLSWAFGITIQCTCCANYHHDDTHNKFEWENVGNIDYETILINSITIWWFICLPTRHLSHSDIHGMR